MKVGDTRDQDDDFFEDYIDGNYEEIESYFDSVIAQLDREDLFGLWDWFYLKTDNGVVKEIWSAGTTDCLATLIYLSVGEESFALNGDGNAMRSPL